MNTSIVATLQEGDGSDSGDLWLNMEQEYIPVANNSASQTDALNMLGLASNGISARKYLTDNCRFVKVSENTVIITLGFYVWPSSLDMPYTLQADTGDVSDGTDNSLTRSLDVILDGRDSEDLGFLFSGTLAQSMPFYLVNGVADNSVKAEIVGSSVVAPVQGYCVYRANGKSIGYYHRVVMRIPKGDTEMITGFSNNIIATWGDNQTTTLSLDIPECVNDALETCDDGTLPYEELQCGGLDRCNENEKRLTVYFNSCDGESILAEHWEENT